MLRKHFLIQAACHAPLAAAAKEQGVRNYYDWDRSDCIPNKAVNPDGSQVSIQAFARSGLFPVASGQEYTFSLDAAADNWFLAGGGVFFWTGPGSFSSYQTSGPVFNGELRIVTFTAPIDGYAEVNLKYAINGVYSTANVIPAGAIDELVTKVMVNKGDLACILTNFDDTDVVDTATGAPDLASKLYLIKSGSTTFYLTKYSADGNMAHRIITQEGDYSHNPGYDFRSLVVIPDDTPVQATPGAFGEIYTPAPANPGAYYQQSDNMPAYNISGIYCGGAHATPSFILTKTSHGKTNANARGSLWSVGGNTYMITRIVDADHFVVTAQITGADDAWTLGHGITGTGTLTHVSGASNTTSVAFTAVADTQLWPQVQNFTIRQWIDGGSKITDVGAFHTRLAHTRISYDIANQKAVQTYLNSLIGSSDDVLYNDPDIDSQVHIDIEYMVDRWGITTVNYFMTALQGHTRHTMWASQHQNVEPVTGDGETSWFFAEASVPFDAGDTHTGGNTRDFTTDGGEDITGNSLEYLFDKSVAWADGSIWSDGIQRPPRLFMKYVKDSGGDIVKKYVIIVDEDEGRTAVNNYSTRVGWISPAEKFYAQVSLDETIAAGTADVTVNAFGPIDPAGGTDDFISCPYPKGGGRYGYAYWTLNGSLSNHEIDVGVRFAGKRIRITRRHVNITVNSTVVSATGKISVSSSGQGGFAAVLE